MKSLVWILRVICVAVGLVAVTLDSGPNLGQRALMLGIGVGFITWLFDSRNLKWVDALVGLAGLVQFRRVFAVIVLIDLALGALLVLNQHAATQPEAMFVYGCAVLLSGLGLTGFMIFLHLKRLERAARDPRD